MPEAHQASKVGAAHANLRGAEGTANPARNAFATGAAAELVTDRSPVPRPPLQGSPSDARAGCHVVAVP
jgi:hypothetical protein